jgi:hypothetical protein
MIRVIGGPWPERIGCVGWIVTDQLNPRIYPVAGLGRTELVVLLDDDPVIPSHSRRQGWSCVLDRRHVARIDQWEEILTDLITPP